MTAPAPAAAAERMSTLDAEFFFAEHANVPLHIGSVAVFDGPAPSREDLMRLFEAKLPRVPRYRQVVRAAPLQLLRPVWADDQEFSLRHHIRCTQVPAPGGPDQLGAVASRLFARPLDRRRPLWEEWLLDGLDGGRWALVSKIHHCMVDGVGGNDLMAQIFSTNPAEPWTTAGLAELKRIHAARDATINDIVLAAITRGFRDLLSERGELTERMVVRTVVPVSVRGQDEAGAVTNRVSAVLANLPVSEPDPLRRLSLIQREMDGLKRTHQASSAEAFTGLLALAAPAWLALGTRFAFQTPQLLVQSVTTNVPGPRRPLYVLGRPLTALHPYVPIGNTVRVSVAILSYVDTVSFGVTADYGSSPDLDVFTGGIQRGLAELSGQLS